MKGVAMVLNIRAKLLTHEFCRNGKLIVLPSSVVVVVFYDAPIVT
jgi:hypothetical protein